MQFPIIIGLRRSRLVDGSLASVTGAALLAIGCMPWPMQMSLPLAGAVLLMMFLAARRLAPPLDALRIDADGKVSGRLTGQDAFVPLRLLAGATAHPWLTVLGLAGDRRTYRVLIIVDSAAPDEFRRLRVWLRWRAEVSDGAGDS